MLSCCDLEGLSPLIPRKSHGSYRDAGRLPVQAWGRIVILLLDNNVPAFFLHHRAVEIYWPSDYLLP